METRIKVTVCPENALWVGIFERADDQGLSAARIIFGKEPSDPELYEWLLANFNQLNFSAPQQFKLIIKRKNPKRMLREVKKELEKTVITGKKESFAQEAIRLELEKKKKLRKLKSKAEKEAEDAQRFQLRQEKKKQKKRGH